MADSHSYVIEPINSPLAKALDIKRSVVKFIANTKDAQYQDRFYTDESPETIKRVFEVWRKSRIDGIDAIRDIGRLFQIKETKWMM